MLIALTEKLYVAPQISVDTVAEAARLGVSLVVNNRPEGESADQTPGETIEAAARAEGLAYVAIPVTHAGFAPWQIDALDTALADNGEGKALLYCRSGTRSTLLWALGRARAGDDVDSIGQTATAAGYDLAPIRQIMEALSSEAKA
ncbi:TIGR01244 family phosphatase [Sphingobium sufflavum]|uniref:TIGR01244 family sulfur transferase n=1 Tax=Sphingobium sufflavum TaxID=1129547 RepID=UPI001F4091B0|nr:TIGR01244 family sulfur transferase [Sphingobium sufflavum]MCE7795095.1 TIGR01244 family phosphatase [Sphingobium sufflavum]